MNKLFFYFTIILVVCFSCSSCINNKGHLKGMGKNVESRLWVLELALVLLLLV